MERIAQGDERAFQVLVERWEGPLFAFMARMLGDAAEAEDLAQETFLRVYAQAGRYRAANRFRSWLFRIGGNLARSRLRRRRVLRWVRFEPGLHDRAASGPAPDRALEREEVRSAVQEALDRLPDRQREAVILRRYQGLSYREIASALGTTEAAVESLLQRAAMALRKDLAGRVEPE
jgi:RNA polymerase sigma-70 factor (ECF subfamily)